MPLLLQRHWALRWRRLRIGSAAVGVYSTATDEIANKLSSVRALAQARDKGQDLLTLCSACHNVIKRVNNDMRNNEDFVQS